MAGMSFINFGLLIGGKDRRAALRGFLPDEDCTW
jgi:hypothetical protein